MRYCSLIYRWSGRAALLRDPKRTSQVDSERAAFQIEKSTSMDTRAERRTTPGCAQVQQRPVCSGARAKGTDRQQ